MGLRRLTLEGDRLKGQGACETLCSSSFYGRFWLTYGQGGYDFLPHSSLTLNCISTAGCGLRGSNTAASLCQCGSEGREHGGVTDPEHGHGAGGCVAGRSRSGEWQTQATRACHFPSGLEKSKSKHLVVWKNSVAGRTWVLNVASTSLIPDTPYESQAPLRGIPEHHWV